MFAAVFAGRSLGLGVLLAASTLLHCGREHPPSYIGDDPGGSANGGGASAGKSGLNVPDSGLDADLCGSEQIPAVTDPPNLYFILDRSGSMSDVLPSGLNKFESARVAIRDMLRAVGHRVNYGAAVYPWTGGEDGCAAGREVFSTQPGDPPSYAAAGKNGPILTKLLIALGLNPPNGGTPTAGTLRELLPTVVALTEKKTYVVLLTDGAPNCNFDIRCGVDGCIPNIEHQTYGGAACDASLNCCDPKQVGTSGLGYCVDSDASEAAVAAYEEAGIDTFVVGMPGSEAYAAVLNRLAVAGHTARSGNTAYYAVSDTQALNAALREIGARVAISCDLPLAETPENPNLVNVYFDGRVVESDEANGWHYSGAQSIQFQGEACALLGSGDVLNVQVLSGCPTVVPR